MAATVDCPRTGRLYAVPEVRPTVTTARFG